MTLKCDFHIHTVISDGYVWTTVRIGEAWRDGPEGAPSKLTLPANSVIIVKADKKYLNQPLRYKVSNIITGNGTVLSADIVVPAPKAE